MRTRFTVVPFIALMATALYVEATRAGGSLAAAAQTPASGSIACSLTGYKAAGGLTAAVAADALTVTWDGDKNQELRLRFAINGGTPTIQELAVRRKGGSWAPLATNVTPEFRVVTARRRMEGGNLGSLARLGILKPSPQGADRFRTCRRQSWTCGMLSTRRFLHGQKNMNRVVGLPPSRKTLCARRRRIKREAATSRPAARG